MCLIANQKDVQKEILAKLGELGGQAFKDEDIEHAGSKMILPLGMDEKAAIEYLKLKIAENEEITRFSRTFRYRPWDGAYCTYQAMRKAFGGVHNGPATVQGLFGPQKVPPQLITLNTGPNKQEQIPWGAFEVPFIKGVEFQLQAREDEEFGLLFHIEALAPRKYRAQIEGLFILIEKELKENSLYRGKCFDGREQPEFIDLSGVDPAKVVYSNEVMVQLEANVWAIVEHTEAMREAGVPRKRAVLIEGPYGTGKTLAAQLTAQKAVANGWTFIMARPSKDDLDYVMQTARLYQPAVVFYEDVDVIASPEAGEDGIARMLDLFDGITAKGTELMAILTTNHADKIHKGMVRPGRLDAVIHIGSLDNPGVEALIKAVVPENLLAKKIDWEPVGEAATGFVPAFIREGADRAVRYALARNNGKLEGIVLDAEDFINAFNGLRPQLELMEDAKDDHEKDRLGNLTSTIIREATEKVVRASLHEDLLSIEARKELARDKR